MSALLGLLHADPVLAAEYRAVSERRIIELRGLAGAWRRDGDRFIFTRGSAIWQLPEGPLHYLDFRMSPGGVRYNLEPEDIVPASW